MFFHSADILASTYRLISPKFDFDIQAVVSMRSQLQPHITSVPVPSCLGFHELNHDQDCTDLVGVVRFVAEVVLELDHFAKKRRNAFGLTKIIQLRNAAQHKLLSLAPQVYQERGQRSMIYRACWYAALIFSDLVLFPLPPATGVRVRLCDELRRTISEESLEGWWECCPGTLTWVLVLGGLGSLSTPHRSWYTTQLRTTSKRLGLTSWEQFGNVVGCYLWWDYVCDSLAMKLWHDVGEQDSVVFGTPIHAQ